MNLLKKNSFVYLLQICGVLILFFYPGCSSFIKQKEIKPVKSTTFTLNEKKKAGWDVNLNRINNTEDSLDSLNYLESRKTNYSFLSRPNK